MSFDIPVVMILFNRPEFTKTLFKCFDSKRLSNLYIVMDGPRLGIQDDIQARKEILQLIDSIDFADQVHTNISSENLGISVRVKTGLDWVFSSQREAIVFEDDCHPDPSFLDFCQSMLNRYRDHADVGIISGTNFYHQSHSSDSYLFSKYPSIWGWATWKRSWELNDLSMKLWSDSSFRESFRNNWCFNRDEYEFWEWEFGHYISGLLDTWDYPFMFSLMSRNMSSIVPATNLVSNCGFGDPNSSHTKGSHPSPSTVLGKMKFPVKYHTLVQNDIKYDQFMQRLLYRLPTPIDRVRRGLLEFKNIWL